MSEGLKPCPFCGDNHPEIQSGDTVGCDCIQSLPGDCLADHTAKGGPSEFADLGLDHV